MPEEGTLTSPLDRQLADLSGVGADRASQLARLKCHTLNDLFLHRPRRHEDRRNILKKADGLRGTQRLRAEHQRCRQQTKQQISGRFQRHHG